MAVAKVFRIELQGNPEVEKGIKAIRKATADMATTIAKAKVELATLFSTGGDSTAIAKLTKQIVDLESKMKNLASQRRAAETDAKREKDAADALSAAIIREAKERDANAKAMKSEEGARKSKIQADQAEERGIRKKKEANDALAGSYNSIKQQLNTLRPLLQSANETSTIGFNGKNINFKDAVAEYKKLSAAEQEFRRQFTKDGLLVAEYASGIAQAFKGMGIDDIIKNQINGGKQAIGDLEKKTNELVVAYRKAQQSGSSDLNKLEKEIHDNVVETQNLKKAVSEAEVQLRGVSGIGEQITGGISKGFKELKNSLGQFALTYVGFQAIFSGLQSGIENAKDLSDQTSNLEVELKKAAGGADNLVNNLSKLDTRTKLNVLEDIANIAAKAGVSEDNLLGVTESIDKIKIAFGKDFGDVETGTESLVKLINIFLGPGEVTGENLLKMGNAIRTLANESVASVPFLNDFSQRMAGLKGISDISLPAVLGLASGFEQFGQSAEVSSTALVKIIPKLATDTGKYAAIAGITKEAFSDLLQNNPAEALIKVSESLVKSGQGIEGVSAAFADSELGSGRIASVLGVLGKNSEEFRKSIDSAGVSFNSTGNIEAAFAAKNENLAGQLDKVSKALTDGVAGSTLFQKTLLAVSSVILVVINSLPVLLSLLAILAASWVINNAGLLLLRASMLSYNLLILRNQILLAALTVAMNINRAAMFLLNGVVLLVTKGFQLLGLAVKATPFGIILTAVSLLGGALVGLNSAMASSTNAIKNQNLQLKIMKDIQIEAKRAIADQLATMAGYAAVVKDTSISEETRLKALKELIKINPEFEKALKGNKIDLNALNDVLQKYNDNLLRKAELEAGQALQQREYSELVRLQTVKQSLEIAKAQKTGFGDLTDEQQGAFSKVRTSVGRTAFSSSLFNTSIQESDFKEAFKDLDVQIATQSEKVNAVTDVLKNKYAAAVGTVKEGSAALKNATASAGPVEIDIEKLKAQIKALDEQIEKFSGSQKDLNKLVAERKRLQAALDKALGVEKGGGSRGSRLTGEQKDLFKDIEANRDRQIAEQKKKFSELEIDEKTYLQNVLKINTTANDAKLKLIKGKNAEERKIIADINLQKVTDLQETNKRLFDIDNKQLETRLRNEEIAAKRDLDMILLNPDLNNTQRLKAETQYQNSLLQSRFVFNQDQIRLEELYNVASIENEQKRKEAIEKIINELNAIQRDTPQARQKDIQDTANKEISRIQKGIAEKTTGILSTDDSPIKKARKIAALEAEGQKLILANQVAGAKIALDQAKKDREAKLIGEQEYLDRLKEYKTLEAALYQVTVDAQISATQKLIRTLNGLKDGFMEAVFGIKSYTQAERDAGEDTKDAANEALGYVKSAIDTAYNAYWAAKSQQLEKEKQMELDALDRQKERVLGTAASEEERATIEREFAQKRLQAEKVAAEKRKKLAQSEAAVQFALGVIKAIAQYLFPAAIPVIAGMTAAYLVQRSMIAKQNFAEGGAVQPENPGNGLIRTRSNIPALRNGDNVLATVKTGEVILNEQQQRKIGGPSVFRRIGVPGFAGGGITGPQLGTSLRPPSFNSGYYSSGVNSSAQYQTDMNELKGIVAEVANAVYASDRKEVVVSSGTMTKSQNKTKRDVSVSTI